MGAPSNSGWRGLVRWVGYQMIGVEPAVTRRQFDDVANRFVKAAFHRKLPCADQIGSALEIVNRDLFGSRDGIDDEDAGTPA